MIRRLHCIYKKYVRYLSEGIENSSYNIRQSYNKRLIWHIVKYYKITVYDGEGMKHSVHKLKFMLKIYMQLLYKYI